MKPGLAQTFFILVAWAIASPSHAITYTVLDLGQVGPTGINASGQVVGSFITSSQHYDAFVTGANGVGMTDLGTLGGSDSFAYGINASGQVVGTFTSSANLSLGSAFLTGPNGASVTYLGSLGGTNSEAYGINASGQVVGTSDLPGDSYSHAFITGANGVAMKDLGTLGGVYSVASDINASGQVVGYSYPSGGLWDRAFITGANGVGMKELGTLGGASSVASRINTSGQVVGFSEIPSGGQHGFITGPNGTAMTDLGTLGGADSWATGINASAQVVGYSDTTSGDQHAFITGANGAGMTDLNSLVSLPGGVYLTYPAGINDSGQIVVDGSNGDGYLLSPWAISTNQYSSPCINVKGPACGTAIINGPSDITVVNLKIGTGGGPGTLAVGPATLTASSLTVGADNPGTASIQNNGYVHVGGPVTIGGASPGALSITGGTLTSNTDINIGTNSPGSLVLQQGAAIIAVGNLTIQRLQSGNAFVTDSAVVAQNFNIGGDFWSPSVTFSGKSGLNVSNAVSVSSGALNLNGPGTYNIHNAVMSGGTLDVGMGGDVTISNQLSMAGANNFDHPTVTITGGGNLTVGGVTDIGANAIVNVGSPTGPGIVSFDYGPGTASFDNGLDVGTKSNGAMTINEGSSTLVTGDANIGTGQTGQGAVTLNGDAVLKVKGTLNIGQAPYGNAKGNVTLQSNGNKVPQLSANMIDVGDGGSITADDAEIFAGPGGIQLAGAVNALATQKGAVELNGNVHFQPYTADFLNFQVKGPDNYGAVVINGAVSSLPDARLVADFSSYPTPQNGQVYDLLKLSNGLGPSTQSIPVDFITTTGLPPFDPAHPLVAVTRVAPLNQGAYEVQLGIEKFNGQFNLPLIEDQKQYYQQQANQIQAERSTLAKITDPAGYVVDKLFEPVIGQQNTNALSFLKSMYDFATEFIAKPVETAKDYVESLTVSLLDAGLGAVENLAKQLANDPPDPNYHNLLLPSNLAVSPDLSSAGVVGLQAEKTINDEGYYIQALELSLISYERYQGAVGANDVEAALAQLDNYKLELGAAQGDAASLADEIRALEQGFPNAGLPNGNLSPDLFANYQSMLAGSGFSPDAIAALDGLGLSQSDQAALLQDILNTDLSNPPPLSYNDAFNMMADSFDGLSTLPQGGSHTVPEPGSLLLFAIGLPSLLAFSCRRRYYVREANLPGRSS